jgi:hypothetical protein
MDEPMQGRQEDPAAAQNMMEGREAAQQPGKETDPVIDALKTIQVAIAALQQKGDPSAQAISQAFQGLIQAFKSAAGGQEQKPEAPQPPPQGAPAPTPNRGQRPMSENQTPGARPVL